MSEEHDWISVGRSAREVNRMRCTRCGTVSVLTRDEQDRIVMADTSICTGSGLVQRIGSGDFSIGSAVWPGTSKLLEEQGELIQVLGKLMATGGDTKHWSGDLRKMLIEEAGDVYGALAFFVQHNLSASDQRAVAERAQHKLAVFNEWHKNPTKP